MQMRMMRWRLTSRKSLMRARNLNDEALAAIVAPPLVSVAAEVVVGSEVEEILAVEEEILAVVEVDLQALDSAVTLARAQDSVVALVAALAIAAAEAVLLVAALVGHSVIAEVVAMVASTRDVLHPRDKAREMRTAIELVELRKSLLCVVDVFSKKVVHARRLGV
jgi:hypothetical protein